MSQKENIGKPKMSQIQKHRKTKMSPVQKHRKTIKMLQSKENVLLTLRYFHYEKVSSNFESIRRVYRQMSLRYSN